MYDNNNVFAKILRKELPAKIIYEDDYVLAFEDIAPASPIHVLVVPKGGYVDYSDFVAKAPAEEVLHYFQTIETIILKLGLENGSYRLITNRGSNSGQTVFHFHMHILAGKTLSGL